MRYATVCLVVLGGCSALAPAGADSENSVPPPSSSSGVAGAVAPSAGPMQLQPGTGGHGTTRFDNPFIEPVQSAVPPAPINGGTLLIAKDGRTAVVADPDRDRVSIADLQNVQVLGTIELDAGAEPGRSVEDAAGRVHVVLRRRGEVASISLATRNLIERRRVCQVPQGIAYDEARDELLVACSEGVLAALPAAGGAVTRSTFVDRDLRDVVLVDGRRYVSRFKSAELLELDASDAVIARSTPGRVVGPFLGLSKGPDPAGETPPSKTFDPVVAWRTVGLADGRVLMLHQRAQATAIALAREDEAHSGQGGSGGSGSTGVAGTGSLSGADNPYGGGVACDSIVRPALSANLEPGKALKSGPVLPAATLAVDAAISPDGRWVAVAVAGSRNASDMTFGQVGVMVLQVDGWTFIEDGGTGRCQSPGLDTSGGVLTGGQVVAVAFDGQNRLVMQTREPNRLRLVTQVEGCIGCEPEVPLEIELGGQPRRDTGHDLFHEDAGAGVACASCHPVGGDDGHTWVFDSVGQRRTQLFNMGIAGTLPLHWDGEFADFNALVQEVFVRRMGGSDLNPEQVNTLAAWLDTLRPNAPMRSADDAAALRGKQLFESASVGCAGCHSGALFTNNESVDVGTGGRLQVPSLVGVAYHQPYIHTGCASTLRERFDPACGGANHGNLAGLNQTDIDDLVAYLETL